MKKLIKILSAILIIALLCIVGIFFFANSVLEKFRPQLVTLISDSLHHQVELGSIKVKFFPSVGIAISDVALADKTATDTNKVGSLLLETSLSQILSGNISITSLAIKDVQVNVKRKANGSILVGNFPIAGKSTETKPSPEPITKTDQPKTKQDSSLAFNLNNAQLENLNFSWVDESTTPPQNFSLSNLNANLSLEASGDTLQVKISLDGTPSEISFNNLFKKNKGELLTTSANIIKAGDGSISAKTFKLILGKIILDLPFNTGLKKIEAHLSPATNIDLSELEKFLPMTKEFGLKGLVTTDLKAALDLQNNLPNLSGTIELKGINLNYTQPSKKPLAVGPVNGKLLFENDSLTAKPINIVLAGQSLELTTKVTKLTQPSMAFILISEKLELSPILKSLEIVSPALEGSILNTVKSTGNFSTASKSGTLNFSLGNSSLGKSNLNSLQFSADITPDKILIKPSSVEAFSGKLNTQGEVTISSEKSTPFSISLNGSGFELGEISKIAMPNSKITLSGTISNLASKANADAKRLMPTLISNTDLAIIKGEIKGINIVGTALNKVSGIPGLEGTLASFIPTEYQGILNADSTAFDKLNLNANLKNENVALENVSLEHALYIIRGNGTLGLNDSFDIKAKLMLTPLLSKAMVLKQAKLKLLMDENYNLVFPLTISRKNGSTLVLPDISQLLERTAKNTAKEAAGRALDKVAPGLGGASKLLDKLF